MKRILFSIVMLLMVVTVMFAQEKTYTVKESQLTVDQKAKLEAQNAQSAVSTYVGVGKEVGVAIKEGLSALNTEVNKFSESPAGKFTMFIIAYKVIGADFIQFLIGIPLFFAGLLYFMYSFRKNCVTRKELIEISGSFFNRTKKYAVVNERVAADIAWGHFVALFIYLFLVSMITFA